MKTTLTLAIILFVMYLAGCDFLGSDPAVPDPAFEEQTEDWEGEQGSFYAPMNDTTNYGGSQ